MLVTLGAVIGLVFLILIACGVPDNAIDALQQFVVMFIPENEVRLVVNNAIDAAQECL